VLKDDVKKHVSDKCSLYAGNGLCHLDRPCPFFNEGESDNMPRCLYFEQSVLPADDKLNARYWGTFGLAYWNAKDSKACKRCENAFSPDDKRQQYCDTCRVEQRTEKAKSRKRKQRQKQH